MKQPSLDVLMQKVDSKYTLVVAAAKRARMLMENPDQEELDKGVKPVSVALEEIAEGKLILEKPREGTK
ncbi:DNA-directed RNA polymerase [Acididesulfobacillus acetoxydans]|uniref:DNA-directed RNA polymerase subunit omega n=1 Tax=Acididesulfobacillus acetoxydans TaxID=1561005 RepID=A0A8S0WHP3_9FIRM|nr:DNA-directed RNA polymerase subunit omega [Acididesulfobacillus acetoxydans]CAA7602832.1 DNA-directed RNA polymerase [Acididesulfobacillus acetoxydans]CEJ05713.1 rpoZ: DNA-directed RNA polymerase, omega subunit [Acididesulfobacillus acetoxydans]